MDCGTALCVSHETDALTSSSCICLISAFNADPLYQVVDSLMCLGPIRDVCVMDASLPADATPEERARAGLQCVVASGNGKVRLLTPASDTG